MSSEKARYSNKYWDDIYEYRHVILSQELVEILPKPYRILSEKEWRELGIEGGQGWEHYAIHKPEPHILFRRLLATSPNPPPEIVVTKQRKGVAC